MTRTVLAAAFLSVSLVVASASSCTLDELLAQAHMAIDEGQVDTAIEISTQAIAMDPSSALAHYSRGVAFGMKHLHVESISDFAEAIRLDPGMWKAYRNRGSASGTGGLRSHDLGSH